MVRGELNRPRGVDEHAGGLALGRQRDLGLPGHWDSDQLHRDPSHRHVQRHRRVYIHPYDSIRHGLHASITHRKDLPHVGRARDELAMTRYPVVL
ncbi:hypothetical protein [Parafrankia sp. FMc2]|uniref:hypothetical protein n=1 Tax=Parafrankia sp. FMc2 TaxID=3233196 RepID=UPI0034D4891F